MPNNPGSTFGTAQDLNATASNQIIADSISPLNKIDYYRIKMSSTSTLNLSLQNLSANLDIQLVQDLNNNGQVETQEILGRSELTGKSNDYINVALSSGTYYIRVFAGDTNANTSYML